MLTPVWCQRSNGRFSLFPVWLPRSGDGILTSRGSFAVALTLLMPARLVCKRLGLLCAAALPRLSRVSWFVLQLGNSCDSHFFWCVAQHLLPGPNLVVGLPILIHWCPRLIVIERLV